MPAKVRVYELAKELDVTNKENYQECVNNFSSKSGGKLDILFNNAGITQGGFFDEIPYETHMEIININIIGVINGIYSASNLLKNTSNSLCITTSSSSGIMGMEMIASYSASKHAVKGLTESLSSEFQRFNSRAADILPGVIDTPMISQEIRENLPKEGKKNILVICPGFASDCVETLEEISMEGKTSFLEEGGENFDFVPCLNDSEEHVDLFAHLVKKYV